MTRPAILALFLLAAPAAAADIQCNPDGTQGEMNACAAQDFRAADAELNEAYQRIVRTHADDPLFVEKLKGAQRAWIQLRDADLEAQFPLAPGQNERVQYGSMYPMGVLTAKAELTRDRTRYLQAHWPADEAR